MISASAHWRSWLALALIGALSAASCRNEDEDRKRAARGASRQEASKSRRRAKRSPSRPKIVASPAFARASSGPRDVSIADIAERAVRSVVNVRSTKVVAPTPGYFDHPLLRRRLPPRRARSLGSGVIVRGDGVILTNHHVVRRADEIRVTLSDDREYEAKLIGSDPKSDLAVLRIENAPKGLVALPMGGSDKLRLGEVVLAIGNPFGVGQTVTMGIVSAVGRANIGIVDYEDFIQTDAAINPGNSGGALVNMRGQLIGINTAILSRSGGYQGIGFAIPTAMARPIMESLLQHGRVIRGWLGVAIQNLTRELSTAMKLPIKRGVLVVGVQRKSPAALAGLRREDVIVGLDGREVRDVSRLRNLVATAGVDKTVKLSVLREGKKMKIAVKLGELPSERTTRVPRGHGSLGGLTLQTLTASLRAQLRLPGRMSGVVVAAVERGSRAAAAGVRQRDVILELNRRPVRDAAQFGRLYQAATGKLLLLIYRDRTTMYLLLEK